MFQNFYEIPLDSIDEIHACVGSDKFKIPRGFKFLFVLKLLPFVCFHLYAQGNLSAKWIIICAIAVMSVFQGVNKEYK